MIPVNTNWIWAGIFGMGIPFVIIDVLPFEKLDHKIALSITIGALLTGLLQYLILKPFTKEAKIWIVSCFIAWILSVGTVFLIDYTNALKTMVSNLILALINFMLILLGGIVMGVITAIFLKRIFK